MRLLGIIGDVSWISMAEYYRLNKGVSAKLVGLHLARLLGCCTSKRR